MASIRIELAIVRHRGSQKEAMTKLVRDTVLKPLELVIDHRTVVLVGVLDDSDHVICGCFLAQLQLEPISQSFDRGFSLEGWQAGSQHEMHGVHELIRVWSDGQERLDREFAEHAEALTVAPAHQSDHLVVELETIWLELDTSRA